MRDHAPARERRVRRMAGRNGFTYAGAFAVLCVLGLGVSFESLAQSIYRWVDKDGKVHYTGDPPPKGAVSTQRQKEATDPAIATTLSRIAATAKLNPVTLYQAPFCESACRDARALLAQRAIPYRLVDLNDLASFEQFKKQTGASEVPVLMIGRSMSKGFEADGWNAALTAAGYPASVSAAVRAAQSPAAPAPVRGRYESALPPGPLVARLFVSPECGAPCDEARKLISGKGIALQETNAADEPGFSELRTLSGGNTVPTLILGDRVVRGFNAGSYGAALEAVAQSRKGSASR